MNRNGVRRWGIFLSLQILHGVLLLLPTIAFIGFKGLDWSTVCFAVGVILAAVLECHAVQRHCGAEHVAARDVRAILVAQVIGLFLIAEFWLAQVEHVVTGKSWLPVQPLGAALLSLGIGLRVQAIGTLGIRFVSDIQFDGQLVRHGIYAWLRHPSEIGLLLIATGAPLLLGSLLTASLTIVVLMPVSEWRIRRENKLLDPRMNG